MFWVQPENGSVGSVVHKLIQTVLPARFYFTLFWWNIGYVLLIMFYLEIDFFLILFLIFVKQWISLSLKCDIQKNRSHLTLTLKQFLFLGSIKWNKTVKVCEGVQMRKSPILCAAIFKSFSALCSGMQRILAYGKPPRIAEVFHPKTGKRSPTKNFVGCIWRRFQIVKAFERYEDVIILQKDVPGFGKSLSYSPKNKLLNLLDSGSWNACLGRN